MKIRVFLINKDGASIIDIENDYRAFNEALKWDDAWNTPTIRVRGHDYICVCSDTGKLRHEPVSALSYANLIAPKQALREPFIVGSIIITKFDGTDDFMSLSDKDIELIESRIYTHGKHYLKEYFDTLLVLD